MLRKEMRDLYGLNALFIAFILVLPIAALLFLYRHTEKGSTIGRILTESPMIVCIVTAFVILVLFSIGYSFFDEGIMLMARRLAFTQFLGVGLFLLISYTKYGSYDYSAYLDTMAFPHVPIETILLNDDSDDGFSRRKWADLRDECAYMNNQRSNFFMVRSAYKLSQGSGTLLPYIICTAFLAPTAFLTLTYVIPIWAGVYSVIVFLFATFLPSRFHTINPWKDDVYAQQIQSELKSYTHTNIKGDQPIQEIEQHILYIRPRLNELIYLGIKASKAYLSAKLITFALIIGNLIIYSEYFAIYGF